MPNFLIIGAQKAGTTALWHYLDWHPQIYMSPVKEPGFFVFKDDKPDFCGPKDLDSFRYVTTDLESYSNLFAGASNEIAIGEASTWYLYSSKAPNLIQKYIPNVKLIAILRNPVDRAYSSFMHLIRDEREPESDFAYALKEENSRINNNWEYLWHYRQMGFYSLQIKRYFEKFTPSQIQIHLYEDLNHNPSELLKKIFRFLNVDETQMPEVYTRLNISGTRKSKLIENLLQEDNTLKNFLKPVFPIKFRKNIANYMRTKNYKKPSCPLKIRQELIEIFREDILELQDLIQRDLSHWLEVKPS